jgi:hypothetical protein
MMFQRREDETITQFTLRRLTHEIISTELEDLAQMFEDSIHENWGRQEIADYLRQRSGNHPTFSE